jgi:dienelactone hydrolase
LYLPSAPRKDMPGILICHSHHRPKEQGELQDMGMTWARGGCAVLVMDQVGHGERGEHPFRSADDYAGEFAVSRQDYYFRYDNGIQLHLLGDSLMGWMVWDLHRGVDLLWQRGDVDRRRIILLGAVAGGGDPCAVAAALDQRIACAVPFNFGGPQPETRYPLTDDAETAFNYAGSGSWESTRNLRRSAAEGFLPWVIVGSIAPRALVYAHEFSWDQQRDPVWQRLQTIYTWYDARDRLSSTHGFGRVTLRPPEASHCTNIGALHRRAIHPEFARWFSIPTTVQDEYSSRRPEAELRCWTPEVLRELSPRRLVQLADALAAERLATARRQLEALPGAQRREQLRRWLAERLGPIEPAQPAAVHTPPQSQALPGGATLQRLALEVEPGLVVPMVQLLPAQRPRGLVLAVAQEGKAAFLKHRAAELAQLLAGGVAVVALDVRLTGETAEDHDRGPQGAATSRSSTELMLGGTMVGARLRDVRSCLAWLRSRGAFAQVPCAVWGDAFAAVNPPQTDFRVPHRAGPRPTQCEPLGGLLALLTALYEDDVRAVYVRGGLSSFRSVFELPLVYIPHDVVVPGLLTAGDVEDVTAALAPKAVRLDHMVDGLNRAVPPEQLQAQYARAQAVYQQAGVLEQLSLDSRATAGQWLLAALGVAPR